MKIESLSFFYAIILSMTTFWRLTMIKNFGQLSLSVTDTPPLYEVIINKDNKWRKIKENIDFSFVNILLADPYCIDYGRPTHPEFFFKLLFIKFVILPH